MNGTNRQAVKVLLSSASGRKDGPASVGRPSSDLFCIIHASRCQLPESRRELHFRLPVGGSGGPSLFADWSESGSWPPKNTVILKAWFRSVESRPGSIQLGGGRSPGAMGVPCEICGCSRFLLRCWARWMWSFLAGRESWPGIVHLPVRRPERDVRSPGAGKRNISVAWGEKSPAEPVANSNRTFNGSVPSWMERFVGSMFPRRRSAWASSSSRPSGPGNPNRARKIRACHRASHLLLSSPATE